MMQDTGEKGEINGNREPCDICHESAVSQGEKQLHCQIHIEYPSSAIDSDFFHVAEVFICTQDAYHSDEQHAAYFKRKTGCAHRDKNHCGNNALLHAIHLLCEKSDKM